MEFKEFYTIVEKWKKQGTKLKIIDINKNETNNVKTYGATKDLPKSGTIISFVVEPSHAHMICANDNYEIKKKDDNTYEVKVAKEHYQIIIKYD